ncbi:MAG TPA: PH domain-containing protein [Mycobacterium sp.]|nr:PH domain-containing protein [Mycobacterium sp.]
MAHLAVGFLLLGLLALVLAGPRWTVVLLVIPIMLSAYIVRNRTVADRDTVTARSLLDSETVRWDDVDGLRFDKGSSAHAQLKDGRDLRLPAVTFATLPLLAEASGGRVPNPYSREV